MNNMLLILGWFLGGLGGSGFLYAYMQGEYPGAASHRSDLGHALVFAFSGPISLVIAFLLSGFGQHGWRLWMKRNAGVR
jgi:hypothetical protein